jgi:hypothetical protein
MPSAVLSDRELAQINAAAVTKEYKIKPHLGACIHSPSRAVLKGEDMQTIGLYPPLTGKPLLA